MKMQQEQRLLAFVASQDSSVVHIHLDKAGVDKLINVLEQIRRKLQNDEVEHDHLFSEDWGGYDLTISDQLDNEKGEPVHHVKIFGWNEEWAEKHGFYKN